MEALVKGIRGNLGFQASDEIRTEFLRKSIHILIAFVPTIAAINLSFAMVLLASGTLFYAYSESLRLQGQAVVLVSRLTSLASRDRDRGRFVLGPVTLAIGAMLALLLYPSPAATIAIYALAFGDGLASLVGKLFGSIRIPYSGGKTLEGSLACFVAVALATYSLTGGDLWKTTLIAFIATIVELVPLKDMDNLVIPVVTGFFAMQLLA